MRRAISGLTSGATSLAGSCIQGLVRGMKEANKKHRERFRQAADRLSNITRSGSLEFLTQEELDWTELLREKFYRLSRGRE